MATLYIPGGLPGRSRTLRVSAGGSLDGLSWPVKDVVELLPGNVDLAGKLAELGGVWVTAVTDLEADPSLAVTLVRWTPLGLIQLRIGGGVTTTPLPSVAMSVVLSDGTVLRLVVAQPVENRTPAGLQAVVSAEPVVTLPPAAVTVAGALVTIGGLAITIGA